MNKYLPIMLDVGGRRVMVIGGGTVAERKALPLLEAGAELVIISPSLSGTLSVMAGDGRLEWISRPYAPGDLQGAVLVYAASDDRAVNEAVAGEARLLGLPVNVASHAEAGTFITPGVLRRGRLTVAVSTSGAGPSAAAEITQRIAGLLGEEYEPYLDFLHELRTVIKRLEPAAEVRARLLRRLGQLEVLDEMRQGTFIPWTPEKIESWVARNREA
ncbi:bifunctional precorrin-2 dehydrogenase/sirohydrochlorin ferrochelatase [Paenibacillus tritici]|uniref:precorrin-2 dehydrogenase/sirohydrochlorin ferrochelatase family protein n=1 Tax=Paenibacillus tritici TaxID=1873425 RepID=UPI001BA90492|nr:NAD(P)-dependent oxidoreductase [Paenibacillus tritici]QUL53833.1 bifunctional precorrin-2 dehydrogenase/sirohydrochlorin ferrochelatase [Paenibacillus tritici]